MSVPYDEHHYRVIAELERLRAEREGLKSALGRLRWNFQLVLSGKPCRDVQECLAEVDAALAATHADEAKGG